MNKNMSKNFKITGWIILAIFLMIIAIGIFQFTIVSMIFGGIADTLSTPLLLSSFFMVSVSIYLLTVVNKMIVSKKAPEQEIEIHSVRRFLGIIGITLWIIFGFLLTSTSSIYSGNMLIRGTIGCAYLLLTYILARATVNKNFKISLYVLCFLFLFLWCGIIFVVPTLPK